MKSKETKELQKVDLIELMIMKSILDKTDLKHTSQPNFLWKVNKIIDQKTDNLQDDVVEKVEGFVDNMNITRGSVNSK